MSFFHQLYFEVTKCLFSARCLDISPILPKIFKGRKINK